MRQTFKGELVTQWSQDREKQFAEENGINPVKGASLPGLGKDILHYGGNSGYQAINLAYLRGATHIYLIGYNMGAGGNTHFFGDHSGGLVSGNYAGFVEQFDRLSQDLAEEGVTVINCTPDTALYQFPIGKLREVL